MLRSILFLEVPDPHCVNALTWWGSGTFFRHFFFMNITNEIDKDLVYT